MRCGWSVHACCGPLWTRSRARLLARAPHGQPKLLPLSAAGNGEARKTDAMPERVAAALAPIQPAAAVCWAEGAGLASDAHAHAHAHSCSARLQRRVRPHYLGTARLGAAR